VAHPETVSEIDVLVTIPLQRRCSRRPGEAPWPELRRWFEGVPGRLLLDQERACIEGLAAGLFGYHLLQIGYPGGPPGLVDTSRLRNHIVLDEDGEGCGRDWTLRGDPSRLPVAGDSIDLVLLQHTLDFASDPHQVLREVERVLIPDGRVLVLGFNPWSLWGLWRLAPPRDGRVPWCGRFLSQRRVQDWLSLLGFDLELNRGLMFRPPFRNRGLMHRAELMESLGSRWWPMFSGVYALQAVKRVSTLTPIKPRWTARSRVVGAGAIKPTARDIG